MSESPIEDSKVEPAAQKAETNGFNWRVETTVPTPKPEYLARTFFTDPPPDIAYFVSVPEEFKPLIDFTRKHFGIEEKVPAALTTVKHSGSFSLPSGTLGTSLRVLYHRGPASMYRGLPFNEKGQPHGCQFSLIDSQGAILTTEQTQLTRISIKSRSEEIRYLIILDFGYLAATQKKES